MKAAVLTSYGSEEAVSVRNDASVPSPMRYEMRIRSHACSLSDADLQTRFGGFEEIAPTPLPRMLGFEVSGVVDSVSDEVNDLCVGDEVCGIIALDSSHGGCAEYCIGNSFAFVKKPVSLRHEEAAACLTPGIFAYGALHYACKLQAGETILITNGASALGHIAVQLAALWNARVFTTANSPEEINFLQGLSCKIVRVIDTSTESIVDTLVEETGGLGLDCIVECPATASQSLRLRKASGEIEDFVGLDMMNPTDVVKLLASHGRWATCNHQLQVQTHFYPLESFQHLVTNLFYNSPHRQAEIFCLGIYPSETEKSHLFSTASFLA
eukprot:TRINITY_DN9227_c0_g1_i1.p1 TRINITY_DN9227_c0_g1~~TRINITY_DN9227_c0_g1_i1.p1  ORF type:complete len:326 (+),score=74.89 TRINITY_DN9227_c0_g1_i1:49-1026(+)